MLKSQSPVSLKGVAALGAIFTVARRLSFKPKIALALTVPARAAINTRACMTWRFSNS